MGDHERTVTQVTATGLAGRRQALQHAGAAALTLLIPLLGAQASPTPVQQVQIGVGLVGVFITWVLPNFTFPGGQYVKALATFATAFGTALVPYLDGGWSELSGTTALIVGAHVLAGLLGVIAPNETAPAAPQRVELVEPAGPEPVASVDDPAPMTSRIPLVPAASEAPSDEALPFTQPTT